MNGFILGGHWYDRFLKQNKITKAAVSGKPWNSKTHLDRIRTPVVNGPRVHTTSGSEGLKSQRCFSTSRQNTDINSANNCCMAVPVLGDRVGSVMDKQWWTLPPLDCFFFFLFFLLVEWKAYNVSLPRVREWKGMFRFSIAKSRNASWGEVLGSVGERALVF